jgi:hypothetical protein
VALACIRAILAAGLLAVAGPVFGTSVSAPAFNSLVGQADYIVRAVVKSVHAEAETGPHGRIIQSYVELDVREVIAGTPPTPLVLRLLGGRVGNEEMVLQGAPQFKVGDEDILFIHGNGSMAYPLVAIMHGRYPIRQDAVTSRRFMARSNGEPLRSTAEVSRPMNERLVQSLQASPVPALTPEQFILQIRQVANQPGQVELQK